MTALSKSHAISCLTLDRQKLMTSSMELNGFSVAVDALKSCFEFVYSAFDGSGAMAMFKARRPMERWRSMNPRSVHS